MKTEQTLNKKHKLSDLTDIVHNLPRLEDDGEAFARDIAQLIEAQPPIRTSPCEPGGIDEEIAKQLTLGAIRKGVKDNVI